MQPCDALTQVSASRDAFGNCAGCSIMSPCLRRFSRQNCASRRRGPELFTARVCSAACRRACNTRRASSSFLHLPVSARPRWSASGSPPSPLAPLLLRGGRSEGGELPTGLNILGLAVGATGILSLIPGLTDVLTGVFGLSQIIWFVWLGIVLLRSNPGQIMIANVREGFASASSR